MGKSENIKMVVNKWRVYYTKDSFTGMWERKFGYDNIIFCFLCMPLNKVANKYITDI